MSSALSAKLVLGVVSVSVHILILVGWEHKRLGVK